MTALRQLGAFAGLSALRLGRDRGNLFFLFVFPLLLVLLIGAQFGGGAEDLQLGVTAEDAGPLGDELVQQLRNIEGVEVIDLADAGEVSDAVARGDVDAGLVVPAGYDAALRAGGDRGVTLGFVGRRDGLSPALRSLVVPVVGEQSQRITLSDLVRVVTPVGFGAALEQADAALGTASAVEVDREELGTNDLAEEFRGLGQFDLGAVQQLLLFVFLSTLVSSTALLQARQWGVSSRLLTHPTTARRIVAGEAVGRLTVGLTQGVYIVLGTLLLFRVDWGGPVAALTILVAFTAVSAGAAMVLGAAVRTEAQASATAIGIGLVVAAIGGSMLPRELMPESMQVVSRLTPHAWAYEAYADVVRRNAGVLDILPELGVLVAMAVALLLLGGWLLQRTLTRPS